MAFLLELFLYYIRKEKIVEMYLQLRAGEDVQKEHCEVALAAKKIFCEQLPVTALALGWIDKE